MLYHLLGMQFKSPTINMFIEDENFVKLVENLEYYLSLEPYAKEESYVEPLDSTISYPKIGIGDIELCCLHYDNCKQAIDKWNKRRQRVNLSNVYIIANSWNLHENEALIKRLDECKYKCVIFTKSYYPYKSCVQLSGDIWHRDCRGIVRPNITDRKDNVHYYFEDQFDFVKWLNT